MHYLSRAYFILSKFNLITLINLLFYKLNWHFSIKTSNDDDIKNFLKKIKIKKSKSKLIRVGGRLDGSYMVPAIIKKMNICFSPGVGNVTNFEDNLKKFGVKSFLIDGTLKKISKNVKKYDFIEKNLNTFNDNKNITLKTWLNKKKIKKKKLILQMDIEGFEKIILENVSTKILNKFEIIIIEFHYFNYVLTSSGLKNFNKIFNKILNLFDICYINPNNCCGYFKSSNIKVPNVLEFTFIKKKYSTNKIQLSKNVKTSFKNNKYKTHLKLPKIFTS